MAGRTGMSVPFSYKVLGIGNLQFVCVCVCVNMCVCDCQHTSVSKTVSVCVFLSVKVTL